MKKNYLYAILVIILLSISVYSYFSRNSTTLKNADFAVKETSIITKIKLSDSQDTLLLELINKNWRINKVFEVQPNILNKFLQGLSLLKVKAPVIKRESKKVVQQLLEQGVKVDLFNLNKLIKSYYIAENDISGATYTMMTNIETPFIIEISGYSDGIAGLYSLNSADWRNNIILSFKQDQIKSLQVKHSNNVKASFTLERIMDGFILKNDRGEAINDANTNTYDQYLSYFHLVKCNEWLYVNKQAVLDSLINKKPENILRLEDLKGNVIIMRTYFIPVKRYIDEFGNEVSHDLDVMYVLINENELVLVNNLKFDLLLKEVSYFVN